MLFHLHSMLVRHKLFFRCSFLSFFFSLFFSLSHFLFLIFQSGAQFGLTKHTNLKKHSHIHSNCVASKTKQSSTYAHTYKHISTCKRTNTSFFLILKNENQSVQFTCTHTKTIKVRNANAMGCG